MPRKIRFKIFATILFVSCFLTFPIFAQPKVHPSAGKIPGLENPPAIDFNTQILTAWGLAGQPWEETGSYEEEKCRAFMDALHHAYETMLSIPLMEGKSVKNALNLNPGLKERLGLIMVPAKKTFYEPDLAGLVRCKIQVPFFGPSSIRSALYLAALRPQPMEPKSFLASWAFLASEPIDPPKSADGTEIKRVVIDLRKTCFEPSLFPRFFSEDGRLLFQEAQIPQPERFSRPVVRFSENIQDSYAGTEKKFVVFVYAHIPSLSKRDIKIASPDEEIFLWFCRKLKYESFSEGEILIIHGQGTYTGGLFPKAASKDKDKSKDRPLLPKARPKK